MTVTVSAPDGSTVDFPDGTDAEVIHGAMMQHFGGVQPPPLTAAQTVGDVATQGGVGFAKGVAGLIGLPGDINSAITSASGKIAGWLGEDPDKIAAYGKAVNDSPLNVLPTSAGTVKALENNVTGPLPEPKSTPGKYAQTIGEFAPAALAGPEGVASNIAKLAVLPGAGSEALGEKVQGSWLEPIARVVGALAGGGIGALGSKGGEILANRSAAKAAAGELGGDVPAGAVNRVAGSYAADKLDPATVAAKSADLGPEAMMLDMGRQMAGRAEAVASQPGAGQNTVLDAVEGRTGQFGTGTAGRVSDTLDQVMGPTPDIVAERNRINSVVAQISKPLYDQVMNEHPVVNVPDSITSRPAVAQAMKDAVSLAKNHGEQLSGPTETNTILQGPGFHIADDVTPAAQTSLGYWDYVKKSMDSNIKGMLKTGGIQSLDSADKADLSGLIAAKQALVSHLDNVTGGAYAVARKASATQFQVNDAIDLGRSSLNTQLLPEELADQMSDMSLPEQAGVKLGMRREVGRIMDTARNDGAAARRLLDTNQNSDKIANVFGQPAADAIDNRITAETQFQDMTNKISANSRTAVRGELMKDTESPSVAAPPMANAVGMTLAGLRKGAQFLSDQNMDKTRQGIANLVTRQGPAMSQLADVLSRYNTARAANVATPFAPQAKSLAAVIAAQQPSWIAQSLNQGNQGQ
jgi:hypothetical protein